MQALNEDLGEKSGEDLEVIRTALADAIAALSEATDWIVETHPEIPEAVAAGAVPYLRLFGIVAGGWLMARAALAAENHLSQGAEGGFFPAKIVSARFFADQFLIQAPSLATTVISGWAAVSRFKPVGN